MSNLSRSAAIAGFVEIVREAGGDPYKFAAATGVPPKALTDPDLLVPTNSIRAMIEHASEALQVHDMGLRMAERRRLSVWGAVGMAMRDQPTLRKALQVLERYLWVQTESYTLHVEEAGEIAVLHLNPKTYMAGGQSPELGLATFCLNVRTLMGETWRPLEVRFAHRRAGRLESHVRVFGVEPQFEQDFVGLVIRRDDLDSARPDADPVMARQAVKYLEELAARRGGAFRDKVHDEIGRTLATGACSVERMAHQLGIDRRTLHRRLAAEETSFTALVEAIRAERAQAYLSEPERPVQRIAEDLGFSGMSAFAHWFRRRFGQSATDYRNHIAAGDLPAASAG